MTAILHLTQSGSALDEAGVSFPLDEEAAALLQRLPLPLPDQIEDTPVVLALYDAPGGQQLWHTATTPTHAAWLAAAVLQAPELAAALQRPSIGPQRPQKLTIQHQGGWAVCTAPQWLETCVLAAQYGALKIPPHLRRLHPPQEVRQARRAGGTLPPDWQVIDLLDWRERGTLPELMADHLADGWGVRLPPGGAALPVAVGAKLASARWVGVSGSRGPAPGLISPLLAALAALAPEAMLLVGARPTDWGGVDSFVREWHAASTRKPVLQTVMAESNDWRHLIDRSQTLALQIATGVQGAAGLLVAFPSKPWPLGLAPSRRWPRGKFGGTFGTLAVAVGNGAEGLVYVDDGSVPGPAWNGRYMGGGWWLVGGGRD